MTEQEAKTKWCPFARIADGEPPVTVNRPEPYGDVPRCLASGCMAWRWTDSETKLVKVAGIEDTDGDPVYNDVPRGAERRGFCGLAGKP